MPHNGVKTALRGVAFTLTTPFDEDGNQVRHDALERNVAFLEQAGARLMLPCGNTGEYYALTPNEREAVVKTTVNAAGDDQTVIAGIGGSTEEAITLGRRYESAGVNGIMVMDPDHTYLHNCGVLEYLRSIVETLDSPVVLYKRGPALSEEVIEELSTHDDVVAVKYAENDIDAFSRAVENVPGDIVWSNGIAERFAPSFALEGAEGFTTGIGNFVPGAVLALMEVLRAEEWQRAMRIRDILRPYEILRQASGKNNTNPSANNVPAVKYGMELAGLYGGPVREPLVELTQEDKDRCERYFNDIRTALPEKTKP